MRCWMRWGARFTGSANLSEAFAEGIARTGLAAGRLAMWGTRFIPCAGRGGGGVPQRAGHGPCLFTGRDVGPISRPRGSSPISSSPAPDLWPARLSARGRTKLTGVEDQGLAGAFSESVNLLAQSCLWARVPIVPCFASGRDPVTLQSKARGRCAMPTLAREFLVTRFWPRCRASLGSGVAPGSGGLAEPSDLWRVRGGARARFAALGPEGWLGNNWLCRPRMRGGGPADGGAAADQLSPGRGRQRARAGHGARSMNCARLTAPIAPEALLSSAFM